MKITRSMWHHIDYLLDLDCTMELRSYGVLVIKRGHWGYSIGLTDHLSTDNVEDQLKDAYKFFRSVEDEDTDEDLE